MQNRHRRTLESIFENPIRADVAWADIDTLLRALGAEITEGRGSRVRIVLNGVRGVPPSASAEGNGQRRFALHAPVSDGSRS